MQRKTAGYELVALRCFSLGGMEKMVRIFGSIFGRADRNGEELFLKLPPDSQKLDTEYIRYCVELEQTVSALEAHLHTSVDPKEIALEALKAACRFYGGN